MRLGAVIRRVTLSKTIPSFKGGRWLIVTPFTRDHFQHRREQPKGLSRDFSLIVYDNLGAGIGDTVGYVEGREAAMPFPQPTPVDAINVAIIDDVFYTPAT
ncbi:MAG: EutN/CcmL family microcompartment protein [Verrucomicrobiia bacterium]